MTGDQPTPDDAAAESSRVRLRRVRVGDADALAEAWLDQATTYEGLAPDTFRAPSADGLGAWLAERLAADADPARRLVLVADVDGTAAGFVVAAVVEPHPAAEHQMQRALAHRQVRVEALAVRRAHQRRGVGTRLLRAVEDWSRNRDAHSVVAQAYVRGPAAGFFDAASYETAAMVVSKRL